MSNTLELPKISKQLHFEKCGASYNQKNASNRKNLQII